MINAKEVDLIIFDMDGTIIPSLEIVYEAIQKSFAYFGWELKYTAEDINRFIGTASGELYQHIVPPEHSQRWEELRDKTRAEYSALFQKSGVTFPRVKETLDTLRKRGFRLVLYSNASTLYFDAVLTSLQIREYFDYTECVHENNLTKTELARKIIAKFKSEGTAIVGDRIHDIETARETGSLSIGVLFGYGGDEPLQSDITIGKFDELLDIFDRKLPVFDEIPAGVIKRKDKKKPFVVGITGIDCAGKTTFATAFEKHLLSGNYITQMIHLDDFHNPKAVRHAGEDQAENYYNRSFNLDILVKELLEPLHRNTAFSTSLSILDRDTDKYDIEKDYKFGPDTIVILEGVFLFRKELSKYIDYMIFLEIPFEESIRRSKMRDTQEIVDQYETKYLPAQRKYLDSYPPHDHADVIIDNTSPEYPSIINKR